MIKRFLRRINFSVPSLKKLIKLNKQEREEYVETVTIGRRLLVWFIYHNYLNKDNYHSFIYAFACQLGKVNPKSASAKLLELNAHHLAKTLKKHHIDLYFIEVEILGSSMIFSACNESAGARQSNSYRIKEELMECYGLG